MFRCFFYVAENITGAGILSYYNVFCGRWRNVSSSFQVKKLCPRIDVDEIKLITDGLNNGEKIENLLKEIDNPIEMKENDFGIDR